MMDSTNHHMHRRSRSGRFELEHQPRDLGDVCRSSTESGMHQNNPYTSPVATSSARSDGAKPSDISRVPMFAALFASLISTVLFFIAVTMFFIYPAMNTVAIAVLLVASRTSWRQSHNLLHQRYFTIACGVLTFFLVVLPWFQMFANIELPGYGMIAWWFERAIQGIL